MKMNYQIVPWFNSKEWIDVYQLLFSSEADLDKKQCLSAMNLWKCRTPFLVTGIESTMTLLEVKINDNPEHQVSEQMLRLAYASAILRFVNHTVDSDQRKSNFYSTAKAKNIPDWIINLRHDIAHNNSLPSLKLLQLASDFSTEWLKVNYWDEQARIIQNYIISCNDIPNDCEDELEKYVSFYISMSLCSHSRLKIKHLAHIPDKQMQEDLLFDAENLFGDKINFLYKKDVLISNLIELTESQILNLIYKNNSSKTIIKSILKKDSLFLSEEILLLMSEENLNNVSKLPKQYIYLWETLLKFLHTHDLILTFIEELLKMTMEEERSKGLRKLAALWLGEIFRALQKSFQFLQRAKKNNISQEMNTKELKQLLNRWFPKFGLNLILDVWKQVPPQLLDISYVQKIISVYNPYLIFFITDLLRLVQPPLQKNAIEKLSSLANLISENYTWSLRMNAVDSKVFSLSDVKRDDIDLDYSSGSDCVMMEVDDHSSSGEDVGCGIWQKAASNFVWSESPLGLLPWQTTSLV